MIAPAKFEVHTKIGRRSGGQTRLIFNEFELNSEKILRGTEMEIESIRNRFCERIAKSAETRAGICIGSRLEWDRSHGTDMGSPDVRILRGIGPGCENRGAGEIWSGCPVKVAQWIHCSCLLPPLISIHPAQSSHAACQFTDNQRKDGCDTTLGSKGAGRGE